MSWLASIGEALAQLVATIKARRASKAAADLPRGEEINEQMRRDREEIERRARGR